MTPEDAANAFWHWSLQAYAADDVKDALLVLQNEHLQDVNHVLWAIWAAQLGWRLNADVIHQLRESTHDMSLQVIRRLREIRRYLKTPRQGYDASEQAALRANILSAEIDAEQLVQHHLARMTMQLAGNPMHASQDWRANARFHYMIISQRLENPLILSDERGSGTETALFEHLLTLIPAEETV